MITHPDGDARVKRTTQETEQCGANDPHTSILSYTHVLSLRNHTARARSPRNVRAEAVTLLTVLMAQPDDFRAEPPHVPLWTVEIPPPPPGSRHHEQRVEKQLA